MHAEPRRYHDLARLGIPTARRDVDITVRRNGAVTSHSVAVNAVPTSLFIQAGRYQLNPNADQLIAVP